MCIYVVVLEENSGKMSAASCSKNKRMDIKHSTEEIIHKKWERFHNWVHCICIVTFDLELGQAIEVYVVIL